jgi:uncharacterized membrane protein YkoI
MRVAGATAPADEVASTPLATVAPQAPAEQRAAEYQQALQTANARLELANRQLEEAYQRLTAQAAPPNNAPVRGATTVGPGEGSIEQPGDGTTGARITADQAAAAARAYVGGGTVERVQLEDEDGQLVYEVRFTDKSKVYVDPVSGQVIYARLERDHEDRNKEGDGD